MPTWIPRHVISDRFYRSPPARGNGKSSPNSSDLSIRSTAFNPGAIPVPSNHGDGQSADRDEFLTLVVNADLPNLGAAPQVKGGCCAGDKALGHRPDVVGIDLESQGMSFAPDPRTGLQPLSPRFPRAQARRHRAADRPAGRCDGLPASVPSDNRPRFR